MPSQTVPHIFLQVFSHEDEQPPSHIPMQEPKQFVPQYASQLLHVAFPCASYAQLVIHELLQSELELYGELLAAHVALQVPQPAEGASDEFDPVPVVLQYPSQL